jgi:PPP family 3-phenylpropionic acid transporter
MSLPPLTPEQRIKPRYFEVRVAAIFWCLFISQGIFVPYFPLWLESVDFDPAQIAVILSAPMFLRVATTVAITSFADRAADRANVLIVLVASALVMSGGFFLQPSYAVVLSVSLALAVVWTPHSPLTDSIALSGVRRFGCNYTRMRVWGSAAFLTANFAGGLILARTGASIVPVLISTSLAVMLVATLFAPRLGRPRRASPLSATDLQAAAPTLRNRYFLLFVTGAGLIIASHAFLYGFVSIYWKSLGIGDDTVGFLWAWGVLAEVAVFVSFTRVFGRRSATTILSVAGSAAVLRWVGFALVWPLGLGLPGFYAVQALHALSTGLTLIGIQKLIAETVSEERTGAAQGIAFFANGTAMGIFTLLSGPLYATYSAGGFYVMAVVAAAGVALIFLARRSAP